MASRELGKLIKRLSEQIASAPDKFQGRQRNEEWTKINFILPLLDELGWDRFDDIGYEVGAEDDEGALDFRLRGEPSIGIEAKALDVTSPKERSHPQIAKGLQQAELRGASYFIWTNGDTWQFFSLALPEAPIYGLTLSDAYDGQIEEESLAEKLEFLVKESFTSNPSLFDEAITEAWKAAALPDVLEMLLNERSQDLIALARSELPDELHVDDEEILEFFRSLESPSVSAAPTKKRRGSGRPTLSFPEDWQNLLDSYEPVFDRSRRRLRSGYYRKLGEYLLSDEYNAWSPSTTWRHVGAPSAPNERKKLGPVIALMREWRIIEDAPGAATYQRVEESLPYLRKLLEKQAAAG